MEYAKTVLSVVSGILMIAAYVPYIYAILRRGAKPSKATWLIWATLDAITIAGMHSKDTLNGQIIAAGIGSWMVFLLSLKYGPPGWTKLDTFCLASAIAGIGVWWVSKNPTYGIVISMVVVLVGSMPTFVSAWKKPAHEDKWAWTISWASSVCMVTAIRQWTLADAAQPITFLLLTSIMIYLLWIRPRVCS